MRLLPILVVVFTALLCSCASVLGEENVSGPELVWKLYELAPFNQVTGIVSSGDGGFFIAMEKRTQRYDEAESESDFVVLKVDSSGGRVWEKTYAHHEGWYEFIPEFLTKKSTSDYACGRCELISLCGQCPGWAWLEHGNPEAPVEYLCRIAHLRAAAFNPKKS